MSGDPHRPATLRQANPTPPVRFFPTRGPGVRSSNLTRSAWLLPFVGLLGFLCLLSIAVGSHTLPLGTAWDAVWRGGDTEAVAIVRQSRFPRTMLGLLAGAGLGVAGALIMALTRNPLADPGILGVNAGAQFCLALAVAFLGLSSFMHYVWFSFAGAVLATVAVYVIGGAGHRRATPVRLTMAGVALGAVLSGFTSAIVLLDPDSFRRMRGWGAGALTGPDLVLIGQLAPFVGVGLLLAIALSRSLNVIALGDDLAAAVGARIATTRLLGVVAVTLLCGSVTAVAGPIGFVGLVVPHVARWLLGPDQRWIICFTIVTAPSLLLAADIVGRVILPIQEVQAGIVTAFIGAPVLIALVRRRRVSGL